MDKQERKKLRKDIKHTSLEAVITPLLDHIDALERNDIRLRNLITRAVGWVEEVKCVSEQAVQEQRSFITELEIAALTQAEEKGNG